MTVVKNLCKKSSGKESWIVVDSAHTPRGMAERIRRAKARKNSWVKTKAVQ